MRIAVRLFQENDLLGNNFFGHTGLSVELDVLQTSTLSEIISRAFDAFGIEEDEQKLLCLVFGSEPGEHGYPTGHTYWLDVVDDQGSIRWKVVQDEWHTITFDQLVESAKLGLIEENPNVIHVAQIEPCGNGAGIDWASFLNQLVSLLDWAAPRKGSGL